LGRLNHPSRSTLWKYFTGDKIVIRQNNTIVAKQKDIAKYFVLATTIAAFIPNGYRY
jgi:hypothetical protein